MYGGRVPLHRRKEGVGRNLISYDISKRKRKIIYTTNRDICTDFGTGG